jgi:pimeloyl-ACP methyl ester carboxylesterase
MAPPDPDEFTIRTERVGDVDIAFVHEGVGGYPIVLLHGYPETKRIWWRNIAPLAEAGFEVIVPDLRGYGDSGFAPDDIYEPAAYSADIHALVHDRLGHETCAVVGGDVGGVVLYDLGLRYPGFVERQCVFNTVPPMLPDQYTAAGIEDDTARGLRDTADYFLRQGGDPEGLAAELDSPERRRAYISDFYGHRLWASRSSFEADEVDFMTEPFADIERLRAGWAVYGLSMGTRQTTELPKFFETNPIPTVVLYGPEDHVIPESFPDRCKVAFTECIGPFVVEEAGHYLQWEQADILNQTLIWFMADLRSR